jgi:hypothetical protein
MTRQYNKLNIALPTTLMVSLQTPLLRRGSHSAINITAIVVCAMALLYAAGAGFLHIAPITVPGSKLPPADPTEPDLSGSGFAPNAVFNFIAPAPHITGVELYGSAVAGRFINRTG